MTAGLLVPPSPPVTESGTSGWDALDLFAGPGGWDEGLRMLGVTRVLGLELEENACATAEAAGHARLRGDLSMMLPRWFGPVNAVPPLLAAAVAGQLLGRPWQHFAPAMWARP